MQPQQQSKQVPIKFVYHSKFINMIILYPHKVYKIFFDDLLELGIILKLLQCMYILDVRKSWPITNLAVLYVHKGTDWNLE